jgi:hypothetical protein
MSNLLDALARASKSSLLVLSLGQTVVAADRIPRTHPANCQGTFKKRSQGQGQALRRALRAPARHPPIVRRDRTRPAWSANPPISSVGPNPPSSLVRPTDTTVYKPPWVESNSVPGSRRDVRRVGAVDALRFVAPGTHQFPPDDSEPATDLGATGSPPVGRTEWHLKQNSESLSPTKPKSDSFQSHIWNCGNPFRSVAHCDGPGRCATCTTGMR